MTRILRTTSLALLLGVSAAGLAMAQTGSGTSGITPTAPGMKLSQSQCQQIWDKHDSAKSGSVSQSEAAQLVSSFTLVDENKDGRLSREEFLRGCEQGHVTASAAGDVGGAATGTGAGSGGMSGGTNSAPKSQ